LKRKFKSNSHRGRDQLEVLQIISDSQVFVRHALPSVTKPALNQVTWKAFLSQVRVAESAEGVVSRIL
jgi:hypothetical protein